MTRSPTWLLRASNNVTHGEAGGSLRHAAQRPLLLSLPAAGATAAGLTLIGEPLLGVLGAALIFSTVSVVTTHHRTRQLTGRRGELLTAAALRHLPDAEIFHDVTLGSENADHVVLTAEGVFTVEVKHLYQLRADRHGVTSVTRQQRVDRSQVLSQALRQSAKVARLVQHPVTPVIAFTQPGSQVLVGQLSGVTLCTHRTLCRTLTGLRRASPQRLSRAALATAAHRLRHT